MSPFVKLLCTFFLITLAAQGQIQNEFFGMGVASTNDLPKVPFGTIAHPPCAWTMIEGAGRGIYKFGGMDQFVKKSPKDANGVALIDIAMGWTPGWAVADQSTCFTNKNGAVSCTAPPDNIQDWADFITTVVNHYNGITAAHVKNYEIWNEASDGLFWTGGVSAMLKLAQVAYPILKQDPYSLVSTPSVVWKNGVPFMTAYLKAGGGNYADELSFHGYPSQTGRGAPIPVAMPESPLSTNAPIFTMIATFRQLADTYGMQGKPLITTEGGWGSNGVSDPDMQAAWIAHYEILQAGVAAINNLRFQDWFIWGHQVSGKIETTLGTPTQAGNAYAVVYGWLIGQQPSPCTSSGNIWSCAVGSNLIVWDTSQSCSNGVCSTSPYSPPPGYSRYVDLTGALSPAQSTMALGIKPIMLEP